jgi:putative FmdB family regulatory protein
MTYEYTCKNNHHFEVWKRMKDSNRPEQCPECGETGKRVYGCDFIMKDPPGQERIIEKSGLLKRHGLQ